jgi:hypothetical protein
VAAGGREARPSAPGGRGDAGEARPPASRAALPGESLEQPGGRAATADRPGPPCRSPDKYPEGWSPSGHPEDRLTVDRGRSGRRSPLGRVAPAPIGATRPTGPIPHFVRLDREEKGKYKLWGALGV